MEGRRGAVAAVVYPHQLSKLSLPARKPDHRHDGPEQRTIRYVCHACLHNWHVTEPDPDRLLQPLWPAVALEPESQ